MTDGPRRGPAPEYSRERIAAAAVAVADERGLDAATMRAVAASLGAGPASLYRYVAGRDELVSLMADAVNGELRVPGPTGDWRADVRALAAEIRRMYTRHPWMLDIGPGGTPMGPRAVDYLEAALALFEPVDAPAGRKLEAIAMLTGAVGIQLREMVQSSRSPELSQEGRVAAIVQAVRSGRYPRLAAAFAESSGAPPPADPVEHFDGLLVRMLGGILTGD